MARTISIVAQSFLFLRKHGCFYLDKTDFIRIWWDGIDVSTLICRPRRFGKTLMLPTVEAFLSTQYANRGDKLFGGLAVWDNANMRALQGSIPVISLSFAGCKGPSFNIQQRRMCEQLAQAWRAHSGELSPLALSSYEKRLVSGKLDHVDELHAGTTQQRLCDLLYMAYGKNTVVLLDEYDTPMQEAWLGAGGTRPLSSSVPSLTTPSRPTSIWSGALSPASLGFHVKASSLTSTTWRLRLCA